MHFDSKAAETVDRGKAVGPLQEIAHFCFSLRKGAEHNGPVGDGFIAGNGDFSL